MAYDTFDPDIAASLAGTVNNTIDGLNVAEGCPAGNMNAGLRGLAANFRQVWNIVSNPASSIYSTFMPKTGGAFTSDISRNGRGGYMHHASSSYLSGQIFVTASGAAQPSGMQVGDYWDEYA